MKALLPVDDPQLKADIYLELAFETVDLCPRETLVYARKLYSTALEMQDSLRMLKGIRLEALAYRKLEMMDSSTIVSLRGVPLATHVAACRDVAMLFNGLALGYMWTADYDRALLFNLQTNTLAGDIKDSLMIMASLNNMGLLYYKLNDYQKAIDLYDRALRCSYKDRSATTILQCYLNLALCYTRKKDLINAKAYLLKAKPLVGEAPNLLKFDFYYNAGLYLEKNSQLDSALINHSLALKQAVSLNSGVART